MKQVKNQVYLTEGSLPIDPGRTTMGLSHRGESTHRSGSYDYGTSGKQQVDHSNDLGWDSDHVVSWVGTDCMIKLSRVGWRQG
jgi:hypothetical protein